MSGQYGRCVPEFSVAKPVAVVIGEKSVALIFISQLGLIRNQLGQRIQWEGKKLK